MVYSFPILRYSLVLSFSSYFSFLFFFSKVFLEDNIMHIMIVGLNDKPGVGDKFWVDIHVSIRLSGNEFLEGGDGSNPMGCII